MTASDTPAPGAVGRWRWGDPISPLRALIARGGVLAIPTESSYGLAADPRDRRGVEAIFRLKGRPRGLALPVVAGNLTQLEVLGVDVEAPLFRRVAALWPAPLTLVAAASPGLPAAAGGDTLAVRIPAHWRLLGLLESLGLALTATSANRSGEPPITEASVLVELLTGSDAAIVDGGRLPGGPPSTMLAAAGDQLTVLRRGRYPIADLRRRIPELSEGPARGEPAP